MARPQPFPEPTRRDSLPQGDWIDRLAWVRSRFARFGRDMLGLLLLVFAALVLLGLLGLSQGVVLTWFCERLREWMGWGSILVVLTATAGGLAAWRSGRAPLSITWDRLIALELAAFLSLALLAVVGGYSLPQAEQGWWGGRIGWSLATLVARFAGRVGGGLIVFILWALTLTTGLNLWGRLEAWLLKQAGEPFPLEPPPAPTENPESAANPRAKEKSRRPVVSLPPQFRKAFRVPPEDEKPVSPPQRGERLPPLNLLVGEQNMHADEHIINQTAGLIEKTLAEFGIPAKVIGYRLGPTVTQFAVQPGFIKKGDEEDAQQIKVRVAQIASLQKDLALALSAERLRIEAPVPGRPYVGIEVPNTRAMTVRLRPILESEDFYKVNSPLAIALGRDVSGRPVVADLERMPHLLIAGTTGSGKSICITSIALCLAMNNTPEDLRIVMIDSKMVELIRFNGLPHLYGKVETNLQRILGVLRWLVLEMERRYQLLEAAHARNLESYNRRLQRRREAQPLPRIVVLIDELADLMMSAPDQAEYSLVRLAQMARATGIHLVVATQRPSTDVVTGLIKANFPARLAFAVASSVDSRVILDQPGAETLLGRGDMLFLNPEIGNPIRAQGVMITDQEIERLIAFWQKMNPPANLPPPWEALLSESAEGDEDEVLIEQAIVLLKKERRVSASLLQRRLRIGYPRAARLLDRLEEMGLVGPAVGGGREREVLIEEDEENGGDSED